MYLFASQHSAQLYDLFTFSWIQCKKERKTVLWLLFISVSFFFNFFNYSFYSVCSDSF